MRRRTTKVCVLAAVAVIVLLVFFTPQGAVRLALALRGQVLDALTVSVEKGHVTDFGGLQYTVRYRTPDPTDRMRPYFFYVGRLTPIGPYLVNAAGTGP